MNEHGLQLKSYWDGAETVAVFHPQPYHMAIPGYVYGGLLASIIDCHGTGTAAAAAYRAEQRAMDTPPLERSSAPGSGNASPWPERCSIGPSWSWRTSPRAI